MLLLDEALIKDNNIPMTSSRTTTVSSSKPLFQVREEPLAAARDEAVALLGATRGKPIDGTRFDWLYRQNPDGPAVLWAVRDSKTGEMAGFTVALPRRIVVDGEQRLCWNGADFSMHPKYRTLGPAIKLRRAAKAAVDAGRVDFLYAHPNDRMAKIHERVGHTPVGRMLRYAKVLKTGPYLQRRLKNRLLAGAVGGVLDVALRISDQAFRRRLSTNVQLGRTATFDERFDRLFAESANSARIIGVRDAQYLNWRYAENPLYESQVLTAEENGRLRGYLVFTVDKATGHIKDLFPPADDTVVCDLIAAMIRIGREQGLMNLSIIALESNPLLPLFETFGFRLRPESSRMFAYGSEGRPWSESATQHADWFLTAGDRDV